MGSTSSTRISVKQAPVTCSSNTAATYPPPAPPWYILDDVKVPIKYYDQESLFENDGFDWSEILKPNKNEQPVTTRKNRITAHLYQASGSFSATSVDQTNHVTKQAPPSVKRPIRSITLHGRDRGTHVTRQRSFTPHRSPNLSRKSTPAGFNVESKIDFRDIDKHAKGATKTHRQSYDTLLQYLLEPIRSSVFPEIKTARALLVWLAYQPVKKSGSKSDTSTPGGLVNAVTNGAETFSSAYVILCSILISCSRQWIMDENHERISKAGLPCELIEGISKSFAFTPTLSPTVDDQWTAVYCEGSWQIVHTDIVCKSVKPMDEDKFDVILDDFFMPTPEYFIYTSYPDDESWQLVSENIIKSTDAFLNLPCLFPSFFKLGLTLDNVDSAILYAQRGICIINILCGHLNDSRLSLTCKLNNIDICKSTSKKNNSGASTDLQLCVLCARQNNRYCIEIRLPSPGQYKLEVFGSFNEHSKIRLCNFLVECKELSETMNYLPFPTDVLMWGPAVICDKAGLLVPSHMTGVVHVPQQAAKERLGLAFGALKFETVHFRFLLHEERTLNTDFLAHLRRTKPKNPFEIQDCKVAKRKKIVNIENSDNDEETFYAQFIECKTKEHGQVLEITVNLPHEGEFGLMITKRSYRLDKRKQKVYTSREEAVCAYFLRARRDINGDNVHQKLARLNMVSLNHGNDRKLLIAAIEKCRKLNISQDDNDVFNAEKWCEFLKHKTDLNDSLHRRNISFLDTTLRNVSCYRYKAIFHTKISRVFHLRHQLVEIRSLQEFEPYLQQATHELAGVDQPPRPVHVTMAAVLLIFGETDKKIEDWSYIKKHLQRESDLVDPPLIRKIQFITEVCPTKSDSRKIITLLREHKVAEIQEANPWTVYFHLWAVKVMSILEDTDPNNIGDFPEFLDFSQLDIEPLSPNGQTNSGSNRDGRNSQTGPRSRVSRRPDSTAVRLRSGQDQMAFRTVFDQQRHDALRSTSRNEADAQTDTWAFASQHKEHYEDERDADRIGHGDQDREDETFARRQRTDIGIQTD